MDHSSKIPDKRSYQKMIKHFIVRFGEGGLEKLKWVPECSKELEITQDRDSKL